MVNELLRLCSDRGMLDAEGDNGMPPAQAKQLGKYLRSAREARGWSARDLAERSGVPDSTIVRIEQGIIASPRPDKLSKIARALGLSLAEVYGRADYAVPSGLPTLRPYLRAKYRDLPPEALRQIEAYAERLAKRHGVNLAGPAPGEDERPEEQPSARKATRSKRTTRKGGTR
jgi:transcriptional regulator with XRE-family HTH domain